MTLDEAIQRENNIAEENQKIVDTQIVFDDIYISQLYCDDTEVIEEHLENYKRCAEYHKKITEWLEELKTIKSDGFTDDLLNMGFTKGYSKAETDYHAQSEKDRQSSYDCGYVIGYKQAIDDLIAKCENAKFSESDEISLSDVHTGVNSGLSMAIHFAEQLKAGRENEESIWEDFGEFGRIAK